MCIVAMATARGRVRVRTRAATRGAMMLHAYCGNGDGKRMGKGEDEGGHEGGAITACVLPLTSGGVTVTVRVRGEPATGCVSEERQWCIIVSFPSEEGG